MPMSLMRVAVADSGVGNVQSVLRALGRSAADAGVTAEILLTDDPDALRRADALVVPGQGSFGGIAHAMHGPIGEALLEKIRQGAPYLGICLGLQVLFEGSEEAEGVRGLGVFAGTVKRLDAGIDPGTGLPCPLPHIGWNTVARRAAAGGLLPEAPTHFYFAHSFAAVPADEAVVAGTCGYGASFVAAVAKDNVVGVQFHPEKSQQDGLDVLARFFRRAARA
jgi:glutamine amidotransferase